MKLCWVEHFQSSKLDSPSPMFWLEENLILSNVLIRNKFSFNDETPDNFTIFLWSYTKIQFFFRKNKIKKSSVASEAQQTHSTQPETVIDNLTNSKKIVKTHDSL